MKRRYTLPFNIDQSGAFFPVTLVMVESLPLAYAMLATAKSSYISKFIVQIKLLGDICKSIMFFTFKPERQLPISQQMLHTPQKSYPPSAFPYPRLSGTSQP